MLKQSFFSGHELPPLHEIDDDACVIVSAAEAYKIIHEQSSKIENIEFMPPKLGSGEFGKFKVIWKFPYTKNNAA